MRGAIARNFIFLIVPLGLLSEAYAGGGLIDRTNSGKPVPRKWNDLPNCSWRYQSTGAPAGAQAVIESAFDAWREQTGVDITAHYEGTTSATAPAADGYCDIFFNVSMASVGGPSGAIAFTLLYSNVNNSGQSNGRIVEADIVINPVYVNQLVTTPAVDPTELDLQEVVGHELGHVWGMSHSFLIDSLMYPAKPDSGTDPDLIDLFRTSKRTLSQDDIATLMSIYPSDDLEKSYTEMKGKVVYDGAQYIGAHLIAYRYDASDAALPFYSDTSPATLLAKGMDNVSAYSMQNGEFRIRGLKPGSYALIAQSSNTFLNYGYSNISPYLISQGSSNVFPSQLFHYPDCDDGDTLTSANADSTVTQFLVALQIEQALCDIQIRAHTGSSSNCGGNPSVKKNCSGGGGCSLDPTSQKPRYGLMLILGGLMTMYIILRRNSSRARRNSNRLYKRKEKDLL